MAWTDVFTKLASLVEATTPTTKIAGAGERFKHQPDAVLESLVRPRGFVFDLLSWGVIGATASPLQRKVRGEFDICIAYPLTLSVTKQSQVFDADLDALSATLPNGSTWDRPTSTIESLFLGGKIYMQAELERNEQRALARVHFHAEWRAAAPTV